jgi:Domain of unknown function (DUF4351)
MSPYQDDDFSKAYTMALYQTKGQVEINVRVKSDENLEVDLLFASNPTSPAWQNEDLGLFDQLMQVHPTIFVEHYSGYLKPQHIRRCLTRTDLYISGEEKDYHKRNETFRESQHPFTWILATGGSKKLLALFGAIPDPDFGIGVYRIAAGFKVGIVVIRELPKTAETLWLRGLGKNNILSEAFTGISDLPVTRRERNDILEVCIKHFKYLSEKSSISRLTAEEEDFMKTMQDIDREYKAEMSRSKKEGQQEIVIYLLTDQVGNLSNDLLSRVQALSIDRLMSLGKALRDFIQMSDLVAWLDSNS